MTRKQEIYFRILGIQPTTDKSIIKKAYRKKAFQYHPDRNKLASAHERFIELTEAYQYLTDPPGARLKDLKSYQRSPEEILAQRMKEARMRYEETQRKEAEEDREYYVLLTEGIRGLLFKILAFVALGVGVLWIADYYVLDSNVSEIQTRVVYRNKFKVCYRINDTEYCFNRAEIGVEQLKLSAVAHFSPIFNDLKLIEVSALYGGSRAVPIASFFRALPYCFPFLLLPFLVFTFRQPTVVFTMLYLFCSTVVVFLLLFRLISLLL